MRLASSRAGTANAYLVCDYCTAFAFPNENPDGVQLLGEGTELDCPVCSVGLVTATVGGVEVLQCSRCEGLLVYQDEFPMIIRARSAESTGPPRRPEPISDAERSRMLGCPMCEGPFDVHPYYGPGHVLIDTCGHCAVMWLDRGEMDTIARASATEWRK